MFLAEERDELGPPPAAPTNWWPRNYPRPRQQQDRGPEASVFTPRGADVLSSGGGGGDAWVTANESENYY